MSKVLYLVRHAKSSWHQPGFSDFDRPLNPRGDRDAPEMGQRLKLRNAVPEIIICSPARRAVETLELMNENMGVPAESIFMQKRIYEASTSTLLEIVRGIDNQFGSAMLIGHNPSLSWLAGELSGKPVQNMPTCSVAAIAMESDQWENTGSAAAGMLFFDYPKNTP